MAVKIVRQPNKIALVGSPTSAAAMSLGHEGAPSALRAAGLIDRLQSIGYEVNDLGDDPPQKFKQDDESPRARNISGVLASLESLKPRVEQAVKSAALPLILTGDCSPVLATVAGLRRYFRHVSLIYMDRDADLLTPATTSTGCLDGMVISHAAGRGAAELVRFWGEPPLVREPDIALFGVDRVEPAEEEVLRTSPVRRYMADEVKRMGPAAAAQAAVDRIQGKGYECVLHFDVDVIADFQATNNPGSGGLSLEEVREALAVFALQKHIAAVEVAAYNPLKDPDGKGAATVIDLLVEFLEKRLKALQEESPAASADKSVADRSMPQPAKSESLPPVAAGQAWSSDDLDTGTTETESSEPEAAEAHSASPGETDDPPA